MKKFIENIKLLKKESNSNYFNAIISLIKNKNDYNLSKEYLVLKNNRKKIDLLDNVLKKLEEKKDQNKAFEGLYNFGLYLKKEGFVLEDVIIFMMMLAIIILLFIQIRLINQAY